MSEVRPVPTLGYWLPVWIWIAVILSASSLTGATLASVDFAASDKLAHIFEFSVLGFLVHRRQRRQFGQGPLTALALAWVWGALVGGFDECYQLLIPGRVTSWADWGADQLGAILGALLGMLIWVFMKSKDDVAGDAYEPSPGEDG